MLSREWLSDRFANQLGSLGHVGLLAIGFQLNSSGAWLAILALIALISAMLWAANYRRSRTVADTPTSRIGSAHQGYAELVGKARPFGDAPMLSPHSRTPCVWYRFRVEERRGNKWHNRGDGCSDASFRLEDGTGSVQVDPERAEVISDHKRRWVERDMRYTEWLLMVDARVYALGEFATIGGGNADLDHRADVGELLDAWKRDRPALAARFDLDRDGHIDLGEWELARRAAQREISRRHAEIRTQPGIHVLRAPRDGRLFVLSNLDPDLLNRRYRRWTRIQLGVAVAAGIGCLAFIFGAPLS